MHEFQPPPIDSVSRRLELRATLREILHDPIRRDSEEFAECAREIGEVNDQLHTLGLSGSPELVLGYEVEVSAPEDGGPTEPLL